MAKAKEGKGKPVYVSYILGAEPEFKQDEEVTKLQLIESLNWYNMAKDEKDAKKYLLDSLKNSGVDKKIISAFSNINDSDCVTVGFLSRMITRGAVLSEKDRETFDCGLTGLIAAAESIVEEKKPEAENKPVVSVQDYIKAQAARVIGEFESILDSKDYKTNVKELLLNHKVKGPQAKHVLVWVDAKLKEFQDVQKSKDDQIKEGYSNYSKAQLKAVVKWLESLKDSINEIVQVTKAGRKPRAKKQKSAAQVVGAVKYLKSEPSLKVVSLDPTQIVGALQLWVFNVKTRKLGVFNAMDGQGLTVKGTTVKSYDETKSFAKTIRKPEVKLPELLKAGKVALRHFMDEIKAKQSTLKGRLNGDVLLVRVVK